MRYAILIFFVLTCLTGKSQDFWMLADHFHTQSGSSVAIALLTGENLIGRPWLTSVDQVDRLAVIRSGNVEELKPKLKIDPKSNVNLVPVAGTSIVVCQAHDDIVIKSAQTLNDDISKNEWDDISSLRTRTGKTDVGGKVSVTYYAKTLLQCESQFDDVAKPVGMQLEIIPLVNPYSLKVGDNVRFKVLWQGKPLFGARVSIWYRHGNLTSNEPVYTMKDGTLEAPLGEGLWVVTISRIEPSKNAKADYQVASASLTIGL